MCLTLDYICKLDMKWALSFINCKLLVSGHPGDLQVLVSELSVGLKTQLKEVRMYIMSSYSVESTVNDC